MSCIPARMVWWAVKLLFWQGYWLRNNRFRKIQWWLQGKIWIQIHPSSSTSSNVAGNTQTSSRGGKDSNGSTRPSTVGEVAVNWNDGVSCCLKDTLRTKYNRLQRSFPSYQKIINANGSITMVWVMEILRIVFKFLWITICLPLRSKYLNNQNISSGKSKKELLNIHPMIQEVMSE